MVGTICYKELIGLIENVSCARSQQNEISNIEEWRGVYFNNCMEFRGILCPQCE